MPGAKQIAQYKKDAVQEFVQLFEQHPIIGIVNMENMPAAQLQRMREQLRGRVVIKMTKKTLLLHCVAQVKGKKQHVEKLLNYINGMPAVLFTSENPFTLFKTLQKNKSNAPAKPGQKAPRDIIVLAGPTSFAPGPIISELGSVGVKAGIDAGKVVIKQDSLVAKEGQVISDKLANVLAKLAIEPMEIGLDLVAVYEKGEVFEKKLLAVDEEEYKKQLMLAHTWAFNLAMYAGIVNDDTAKLLIQKAWRDARALALQGIPAQGLMNEILQKAEREALALKTKVQ